MLVRQRLCKDSHTEWREGKKEREREKEPWVNVNLNCLAVVVVLASTAVPASACCPAPFNGQRIRVVFQCFITGLRTSHRRDQTSATAHCIGSRSIHDLHSDFQLECNFIPFTLFAPFAVQSVYTYTFYIYIVCRFDSIIPVDWWRNEVKPDNAKVLVRGEMVLINCLSYRQSVLNLALILIYTFTQRFMPFS